CVLSVTPQSSVSLSSSRSDALDNGTPVNLSNVSSITQPNRTRSRRSSIRAMSSSRLSNSNISDVDTNTTRSVDSSFSRYWDCGVADHRCQHCQAVLWKHIKLINSMFAFTSTGGHINRDINDGHEPYTFYLNGHNHHPCVYPIAWFLKARSATVQSSIVYEVSAPIPGDGNPTDCRDVLIEERSTYNTEGVFGSYRIDCNIAVYDEVCKDRIEG
nr:DNA helicase PIF1/RRM3 [Tanacetum cinerariifolium]